jgi:hypothetical protein
MAAGGLIFREELHAIDAVITGQGIGLLSDVLVAAELASGELVKLFDLALPGFGFYLVYPNDHLQRELTKQFLQWILSALDPMDRSKPQQPNVPAIQPLSAPPRLSIVVLPFTNIGADKEQEYFVDGITESLTTDLSRISGAFVIARNSAFAF